MKKFVLLYYGYQEPTPEFRAAIGAWFASMGDHFIDSGSPFAEGREITTDGTTNLTLDDPSPITGYAIISAESLDEAEQLVAQMPIIDALRIYEARPM